MATRPRSRPVPNNRLRALRLEADSPRRRGERLSPAELATAVNLWIDKETGHPGTVSERHIRKIESGAVRCPRDLLCRALHAVLSGFLGRPVSFAETGLTDPSAPRDRGAATGTDVALADDSEDVTTSEPREAATNRRTLLELVAGAGMVPALTSADRMAELDSVMRADDLVTFARTQLDTIGAAYPTTPPHILLGDIHALQRLLDTTRAHPLRPTDQTEVWRLSGNVAGLEGWVHNNAGNTAAARQSLREAFRWGEALDDDVLRAWVRYMQSVVEDYAGNPNGANLYAVDGIRYAPTGHQRAELLAGALAPARAAVGDRNGVDHAVNEAREIVGSLPADQQGRADTTILENPVSYHPVLCGLESGMAYARLGDTDRFTESTADARATADTTGSAHRAIFRMDEALTVANSPRPDLERVAALASDGLTLATPYQTAHVGNRLEAILTLTTPVRSGATRQLTEAASTWRARATPTP